MANGPKNLSSHEKNNHNENRRKLYLKSEIIYFEILKTG